MKNSSIFICKKILKLFFENFLNLLISIIFFFILTPASLIIKVLKIDLLDIKKNQKKNTYWKIKKKHQNMKKQF